MYIYIHIYICILVMGKPTVCISTQHLALVCVYINVYVYTCMYICTSCVFYIYVPYVFPCISHGCDIYIMHTFGALCVHIPCAFCIVFISTHHVYIIKKTIYMKLRDRIEGPGTFCHVTCRPRSHYVRNDL